MKRCGAVAIPLAAGCLSPGGKRIDRDWQLFFFFFLSAMASSFRLFPDIKKGVGKA